MAEADTPDQCGQNPVLDFGGENLKGLRQRVTKERESGKKATRLMPLIYEPVTVATSAGKVILALVVSWWCTFTLLVVDHLCV